MKKTIFSLFALFACISTFGQRADYSFTWDNGNPPQCNPFITNNNNLYLVSTLDGFDNWKVSHGSPALIGSQGEYNIGVLEVNYNRADNKFTSEGLYIKAPFSEGYYYNVYVTCRRASGYVGLSVYATNGLSVRTETTCILEAVPSITEKQLIIEEVNAPQPQYGSYTAVYKENFLALTNYNHIWLYSTSNVTCDPTTGSVNILGFYIVKGVHETVPPTTPTSLTSSNPTSTGFKVTWTGSTDNIRVAGYQIFLNNSYYASTANTNYTFSNLTTNQIYNIKIKAFDLFNNLSSFSNEASIYITPDLNITGSTSELCNENSRTFSTATYSNATYQWSVGNGLSLNTTTSPSVSVTADYWYNGSTTITLTRTLVLNGLSSTKTLAKSIWIGVPNMPTAIYGFPKDYEFTSNNIYEFDVLSWVNCDWTVQGGFLQTGQGTNHVSILTGYTEEFPMLFELSVSAVNSCGSSDYFTKIGYVIPEYGRAFAKGQNKNKISNSETFNVYPNPTNNIINIELPKSLKENSLFEIKIYDMLGKLILTKSSIPNNSKQSIDLSQYNSGNYVIIISNSEGLIEKQMINLSK